MENNQEGYITAFNVSTQGARGGNMCEWSCYQMDLQLPIA